MTTREKAVAWLESAGLDETWADALTALLDGRAREAAEGMRERCARVLEGHYWDSFTEDTALQAHVRFVAAFIRALTVEQEVE